MVKENLWDIIDEAFNTLKGETEMPESKCTCDDCMKKNGKMEMSYGYDEASLEDQLFANGIILREYPFRIVEAVFALQRIIDDASFMLQYTFITDETFMSIMKVVSDRFEEISLATHK